MFKCLITKAITGQSLLHTYMSDMKILSCTSLTACMHQ